jgi:hypothetical protein
MRRFGLFVSLLVSVAVSACSSSSGGGTGGGGGSATAGAGGTAQGGAGGKSSGGAGASGSAGTSGNAGTSGGGAGGSIAACGDATGTGSGATCSAIAAGGPCVTSTLSTTATPLPVGGPFAAGTYNLVSQTSYGPADAGFFSETLRQTYVLSNVSTTSFTLDQIEASGTAVARAHGTVAVSGMTATFTPTCPATDGGSDSGGSAEFTATSSSITLFQSKNGLVQVSVYDKAS